VTPRIIPIVTIILALAVTVATATVVAGYWKTPAQRDLIILGPPLLIPLLAAGIGLISAVLNTRTAKSKGVLIGACMGCLIYLIYPALQLLLQYDMVRRDGTGFWAVITLPSVFLGIPCPVLGSIAGLGVGTAIDCRRRKRDVQQDRGELSA
jgi:hypothetical protein